jgi:hypothetical protein
VPLGKQPASILIFVVERLGGSQASVCVVTDRAALSCGLLAMLNSSTASEIVAAID